MFNKITRSFCTLIIILVISGGCKKFERTGTMKQAGVMLSFDDNRVDNWVKYLPMLDSAGAKCTFYICKYNRFSAQQKAKLTLLKNHGHEIAYHTTNHYNMLDYLYRSKKSMADLINNEILAGMKKMNSDGFYPTTFAYPYGAHNGYLDQTLLKYFKSVRALNGSTDYSKSLVPTNKNSVLFGIGLDKSSKLTNNDIDKLLQSAKNHNNCVVFVAHDINTGSNLSISKERLKHILDYVNNNGLKFYTAAELSD